VYNYTGISGKPICSHFESYFSNLGFSDNNEDWNLCILTYDTKRVGYSMIKRSGNPVQGYMIEKDSFGKNIITGDNDGYSPINILEVYEVVNSTAPTGLTGNCKEGYYCTGSSKTPT
jgi:hypothetical protein